MNENLVRNDKAVEGNASANGQARCCAPIRSV